MDAKQVYTVEVIKLLDGATVTIRPFSLKQNRVAKKMLDKIVNPDVLRDDNGEPILDENGEQQPGGLTEEEAESLLIEVTAMALARCDKKYEDHELVEEVVDELTMFEIIKVTTGYDFLAMQKRVQEMIDAQVKMGNLRLQS